MSWENTPFIPIYDRYSRPPDGWDDHSYVHYYEIAVAANAIITQLPLLIDTDAEFYWRTIMSNCSKQFDLRFWDGFGNQLADQLDLEEQISSNAQPALFYPETLCLRGSTLKVDITEYTGNPGTLKLAIFGVKRYPAEIS